MKNNIYALAVLSFCFISCRNTYKSISIKKIDLYKKVDTLGIYKNKLLTSKHDYFIIENFHDKVKDSLQIFEFIKKNNRHNEFYTSFMYFYKESNITNLKKFEKGPGEITYESDENDLLYTIIWQNNKCCIHSYKGEKKEYEICRDSL